MRCPGQGAPSARETTIGQGFPSPYQPDKGRSAIYRSDLGPVSCGYALCAAIVGNRGKRSGESRLEGARAPLAVVADKTFGSRAIRQLIADDGALAVIPSKSNAREPIPHDAGLYKMRNIVERFFCTMKDMRRLATRFEKLSRNFLAMIHIFAIRLWIN